MTIYSEANKSMHQEAYSYQNKTCDFTGKAIVMHQTVNLFPQVKTKDWWVLDTEMIGH